MRLIMRSLHESETNDGFWAGDFVFEVTLTGCMAKSDNRNNELARFFLYRGQSFPFGFETCDLQQGFLPKFRQHVALVYGMMLLWGWFGLWLIEPPKTARQRVSKKKGKKTSAIVEYTRESVNTLVSRLVAFVFTRYMSRCVHESSPLRVHLSDLLEIKPGTSPPLLDHLL